GHGFNTSESGKGYAPAVHPDAVGADAAPGGDAGGVSGSAAGPGPGTERHRRGGQSYYPGWRCIVSQRWAGQLQMGFEPRPDCSAKVDYQDRPGWLRP